VKHSTTKNAAVSGKIETGLYQQTGTSGRADSSEGSGVCLHIDPKIISDFQTKKKQIKTVKNSNDSSSAQG